MQAEQIEAVETALHRATVGNTNGLGRTPLEAVDNLLAHFAETIPTPIVIWPYTHSDECWSELQQKRLLDLRSRVKNLTLAERHECEHLAEASLKAATVWSQAVLSSSKPRE